MFKLLGTLSNSLTEIITSLASAITPLARAAQNGSEALELHSVELKADADHQCKIKAKDREAKLLAHEQSLLDMEAAA